MAQGDSGLEVTVACALILGDAWERSYGDLQWRHCQPERVRPSAFCAWTVDEGGCSLWLDVRNGGSPVRRSGARLGDRRGGIG